MRCLLYSVINTRERTVMTDPYTLYSNLEILDMTKSDHVKRLQSYLEPEYGSTHAVQSILFNMLGCNLNGSASRCKTVIVENEYFDREFSSCYGRFYYHLFQNISKKCKRLHFFAEPVHQSDLLDLEGKDSYLGFVVLRPISATPIGRTVLTPQVKPKDEEFILTQTMYGVNLSGSRLFAKGMPFIQQDGRVAACASAALWMATDYLSAKYKIVGKSSIEITELATGYDFSKSRSTPGRGLTIPQMLTALNGMGYSPQLYDHPWTKEAKQTIYRCVESRIPALLALSFKEGHHSIVTIGHTFHSPATPELNTEQITGGQQFTYYDNVQWLPEFIIHDDQGGLYGRLKILQLDDFRLKDTKTGELLDEIDTGKLPLPLGVEPNIHEVHCPIEVTFSYRDPNFPKTRIGNLFAVIVPMPPGVSLLAEDAARKAHELIIVANYLYDSPNLSEIVLRTYLISSNDYKESLKYRTDMPLWLRQFYRGKPMSRNIWITEISCKDLFDKRKPEDRKMFGEILLDSAASPYTPSFLALHVPGYIMTMNPEDTDYENALFRARNIPDDHPYSHSIRV